MSPDSSASGGIRPAPVGRVRVVPPDERLGAEEACAAKVEDRLIVNLQPAVGDRGTQPRFERSPADTLGVHLVREEFVPIPAAALGMPHRDLGLHHQSLDLVTVAGRRRDPDAHRAEDRGVSDG